MPQHPEPAFRRLFIALAVPESVRDEIARAQEQLKRSAPLGLVRWSRPDQFHLTLKFLGDMPAAQIDQLKHFVLDACAGFSPLQLTAKGLGFFPNARRPRVIWVGTESMGEQLGQLQCQVHAAVLPLAPADTSERFAGHITLGRFKPGYHGSTKELLERASRFQEMHFGNWLAEEVTIVRSELSSRGADHVPIYGVRLTGGNS